MDHAFGSSPNPELRDWSLLRYLLDIFTVLQMHMNSRSPSRCQSFSKLPFGISFPDVPFKFFFLPLVCHNW